MKVTKLIREYVEEQVSKVYDAKENPYYEQSKMDAQKIAEFKDTLKDITYKAVEEFLSKNNILNSWTDKPEVPSSDPTFHRWKTQAMLDAATWNKENTQQKNAKIREIMLALELGANRQELNDMIAKLLEDIND